MGDVMEVARARQTELQAEIAEYETKITGLREEIEALADFVEYGQALLDGKTPSASSGEDASEAAQGESKDITEMEFDADFDPFEDDESEGASVQQLHADRPVSRPA